MNFKRDSVLFFIKAICAPVLIEQLFFIDFFEAEKLLCVI